MAWALKKEEERKKRRRHHEGLDRLLPRLPEQARGAEVREGKRKGTGRGLP